MKRERDMYVFGGEGFLHMENEDTLMNGHWEELFGKGEELLHATHDPDNYCMHIRAIIQYSSDGRQRLESKLHVIKCVQGVIEAMSSSDASGCASTLVDFQQTTGEEGRLDISICVELREQANELAFNC